MGLRQTLHVLIVWSVLAFLPGPAVAAQGPDQSASDAISELKLQTELPADARLAKPPPNAGNMLDFLGSEGLRITLWASVIVGACIIAYALRDSLPMWDRSRRIVAGVDDAPHPGGRSAMRVAQLEADELAQIGRFVEAMHVLLLQSLAETRKRLGVAIADSLTSREILRRVALPDGGRMALGAIIEQVERTYFGEQMADGADYAACRRQYDALQQALGAGRAA